MYYVYLLISLKDGKFYTGYTENLDLRTLKHNGGFVLATKHRRPLRLIYYEACLNRKDAMNREIYLKSAWGKRFIKNRIKYYLKGPSEIAKTSHGAP